MKPIIVYKDSDGNVKMTSDEFQRLIDDAYNRGHADGMNVKNVDIAVPSAKPWWEQPWPTDHVTITCKTPQIHY